ncbi:MAG: hypothetical protein COV55_03785 [Candidatus Komeilibacteria bacterium CG11_big_fil_rev_8_21_14_0_20_36_20]|uniref:Deoxynucleoside kinase domain-containing protein n=1 Tax=Candidatus Komeilibacteria bacterium CG11_big_fil_rev_8_21_14_0_20_36_20 TaxID=1974477 RepID=A0A2H0NCJ3_9BACT|nr:MAG: hypothetical protein COV55_03785 [Candidatus Komeilibacteria bacterium CG11_big_fil_rev_8_21_14_0_20_36_20]PIR81951.1 MAG: hypothetical protein COU21_01230 [Candidatus Komeilibacteria bacterium CG10_big_fil_rev_8_21_14_0_10_36_65]PJC55483.1 MAG: hypothetical protein CO027_01910 [Candidatus Komeilibacteria bacterium CG_4_9_14_0_2_um_filter_36_13]
MKSPQHKIIFEGPELSGKSYLMSQLFDFLEPKYNSGSKIMDGCHWFNCDVGIFGTKYGQAVLTKYLEIMGTMSGTNIMIEKFHLTEAVYQKVYNQQDFDFSESDNRLNNLNAKIILTTFDEDEELLKKRLQDRLNLYPHYQRIAQEPADYIRQQQLYLELIKKSQLKYLVINASQLPNQTLVEEILKFLGEK